MSLSHLKPEQLSRAAQVKEQLMELQNELINVGNEEAHGARETTGDGFEAVS